MKLWRTNAVLFAVAAALFAAHAALRPDAPLGRGTGDALFPGLVADHVALLTVRPAVDDPTTSGVRLERDESGWRVVERFGFPAAAWPAQEALVHLPHVGADDRLSTGGGAEFGLDAPGAVEVDLVDARGTVLAAFDQVAARGVLRTGRATGSVLRARGERSVHRAPLVPPLDADPDAWIELSLARIFGARAADAERVTAEFDGARALEVVRDGGPGSRWLAVHPRERAVPTLRVETLLASLDRLHLDRVVAASPEPEHGLAVPAVRLVWRIPGPDGDAPRELTLALARTADGAFLATSPQWRGPWVVHLPAGAVGEVLAALDAVTASLR